MAKRRKAEEHSLLLRSAESLGRVIGTLQRQLNDASRRLGTHKTKKKTKKKTAARPAARKRKRTTR